jgi:hypothetical protein
MELFLNFLWLMLALPAVLVWRRHSTSTQSSGRQSGRQSLSRFFVLLGCLLALLFPVVSASDDLHPVRAEIEESGASKRAVKQSLGIQPQAPTGDGGGAARLVHLGTFRPDTATFGAVSDYLPDFYPRTLVFSPIDGRAPPEA